MSISAFDRVTMARGADRPTALYYIKNIFSEFIELHGDRNFRDDPSIVAGIATLSGIPVTVIGQEKGVTLDEKSRRNFGSVHPEGYRKSLRLMEQADKFGRPIICLVDTQGAYCGIGAEERGQGEAIARNLREMMRLNVPVISVILGEGGSGGALALAVANRVLILENAVYSILSPEGFASILWKDSTRAAEAAEAMKMTSGDLLDLKMVDMIVPEPEGGAQADPTLAAQTLKDLLTKELTALMGLTPDELKRTRHERFRRY